MALPPRFLNSVYNVHPDDDSMKEVTLHAKGLTYSGMGDRHVLLQWNNATTEIGPVMQIIQLTVTTHTTSPLRKFVPKNL